MALINPDKFRQQIKEAVVGTIAAQQQAVNEGMQRLLADFKQRIFAQGLAMDGSKIGSYSTKPLYISPASLTSQVRKSSIKPKGKNSSDDFKNGKKRKSQYMPQGYSEFRQVVGRQNKFVDLNLTGATFTSIQLGETANGRTIGFINDKALEIAQGNQDRFGKTIFAVSEEEADILVEAVLSKTEEAFFAAFE